MQLRLVRRYKAEDYTIGTLYVDGVAFCDTIEDKDRGLADSMTLAEVKRLKVYGKTAIPVGRYRIDMKSISTRFAGRTWAKRYNGIVPRLEGVKGFAGVLIHVGNTADDTLGCIIVGENKVKGKVVNSQKIYYRLMDDHLIPSAKRNEYIYIDIV